MHVRGDLFAKERNLRALSQGELAAKIGITPTGVYKIEAKKHAKVRRQTFRKIADAWGVDIAALHKLIGYNGYGKSVGDELEDRSNIELGSEVPVPEIPLFTLPLAAGDWMEITDLCEVGETQLSHGLFRVRLQGDSMKPSYPDGTIVEFRCLRADREGPEVGKDYYVQRSDGYATFKRVAKLEEDSITLEALNKKQRPKYLVVPRQEVTRMAIAMAKVQLV